MLLLVKVVLSWWWPGRSAGLLLPGTGGVEGQGGGGTLRRRLLLMIEGVNAQMWTCKPRIVSRDVYIYAVSAMCAFVTSFLGVFGAKQLCI